MVDGPAKTVDTPQREDPSIIKVAQKAGFDSGTGAFASLTTSTVEVVNGHTFVVRQDFANGATGAIAYHLYRGGDIEPGAAPDVHLESLSATAVRYTFSYAIAATDLPADLRAQVLAGLPASAPSPNERDHAVAALVAPAGGPGKPADGEPVVIDIIVDGVVSQAVEMGIDKGLETAQLDKTHAGTSWDLFKAGKKLWEAANASSLIKDALAKIRAVRKCVENPPSELTRKQYEQDPAAKEQVLKTLEEAENNITANAMATFGALLTDTGAGLLKTVPWLGLITGPATGYVKETLASVINEDVRRAQQLVPGCGKYRITGDSKVSVRPVVVDIHKPFTVKGFKQIEMVYTFTPNSDQGLAGTMSVSGHGDGFTLNGGGSYKLIGTDPGPYKIKFTMHGCVDIGGCSAVDHVWTATPVG